MDKDRELQRRINRANKKLADLEARKEHLSEHGYWEMGYLKGKISVLEAWLDEVYEATVVRCSYCNPSSQDYNPCWLCKKGGTAHDVEHCHKTNYGDYEPMQPHCHLCGRKL